MGSVVIVDFSPVLLEKNWLPTTKLFYGKFYCKKPVLMCSPVELAPKKQKQEDHSKFKANPIKSQVSQSYIETNKSL